MMDIQGLIKAWLNDNKQILSIRAIEQKLDMPPDTLQKVMQDDRKLPKKWLNPLIEYLDNMTKSWVFPKQYKKYLQIEASEKINWELFSKWYNQDKRKKRLDYIPKLDKLLAELRNNTDTFIDYLRNLNRLFNEVNPLLEGELSFLTYLTLNSLNKLTIELMNQIKTQPKGKEIEETTEFYT